MSSEQNPMDLKINYLNQLECKSHYLMSDLPLGLNIQRSCRKETIKIVKLNLFVFIRTQ